MSDGVTTYHILTETGDALVTETGGFIVTFLAPQDTRHTRHDHCRYLGLFGEPLDDE